MADAKARSSREVDSYVLKAKKINSWLVPCSYVKSLAFRESFLARRSQAAPCRFPEDEPCRIEAGRTYPDLMWLLSVKAFLVCRQGHSIPRSSVLEMMPSEILMRWPCTEVADDSPTPDHVRGFGQK